MERPKYYFRREQGQEGSGEQQICFPDYEPFLEWHDALVLAVESCYCYASHAVGGYENQTSMNELLMSDQQ